MKNDVFVVKFSPARDEHAEILCALAFACGAEGVSEEELILTASFPQDPETEENWSLIEKYSNENLIDIEIEKQAWKNWNESWEKNFKPVRISETVLVRASFHPHEDHLLNIVINPQMAFGTGHHATTAMMIEHMTGLDFQGKNVLDFGCGSGILSILASKLGAENVVAIDYDAVSTENTIENIRLNQVEKVEVLTGDKNVIPNKQFNIILANINKNVILDALSLFAKCLEHGGELLISGILNEDQKEIIFLANQFNLMLKKQTEQNNWLAIHLTKS